MAKVAVDKIKLDSLAEMISAKSGESLPLTIQEMEDAVYGIHTNEIIVTETLDENGGTITDITTTEEPIKLQSKSITAPDSGNTTVNSDNNYNGLSEVIVSPSNLSLINSLLGTISGDVRVIISSPVNSSIPAFFRSSQITSLVWSVGNTIPDRLCNDCKKLINAEVHGSIVPSYGFAGCTKLESVVCPEFAITYANYSKRGDSVFQNCQSLVNVNGGVLPLLATIPSYAFSGCYALPILDLPLGATISANGFANCRSLTTLILRKTTVATLSNVNAFTNTPFRGYGGTYSGHIYVPQSLISSYQTATNWSTLYASYSDLFQPIEGSDYENYYADGSEISS